MNASQLITASALRKKLLLDVTHTYYCCCEHCGGIDGGDCHIAARHDTPCSFVAITGENRGHKTCVRGQIPSKGI